MIYLTAPPWAFDPDLKKDKLEDFYQKKKVQKIQYCQPQNGLRQALTHAMLIQDQHRPKKDF